MPVYWRRGGSATFDLLLQNSSITKQKSIGSFIVTLMNSPITKQKSIGSFIVTLMNSPITKRCFVIADGCEESQVFFIEIFPPFSRQNGNVDECMCNSENNIRLRLQADIIYNNVIESYLFTGMASMRAWWRPPSNGVLRKISTHSFALSWLMKRPGITITFASLC